MQQLAEAIKPLTIETKKLSDDHDALKKGLNCELEQHAELTRNKRQEVRDLLKLNSKIKEYMAQSRLCYLFSFLV